jgi:hypothetical protein
MGPKGHDEPVSLIDLLESGPLYHFAEWPEESLRVSAPGVYTVWLGEQFLYVGISWQDRPGSRGLFGRLNSHASGRRSGDQFCIYICDSFIVPMLAPDQLQAIGARELSLDQLTRDFIRSSLGYRAIHTSTGAEARLLEASIRLEGLPKHGPPMLNPASGKAPM